MKEERILRGKWFLPNLSNEALSGTFHYNRNEGCYIELFGSFEGLMPISKRQSVILGITLEGGKITLIDCIRRFNKTNFNGITVSRYFATFAFIGEHLESPTEVQFKRLWASIADFESWVGVFGFNKLNVNLMQRAVNISYQEPQEKTFEITNDFHLCFEFQSYFPISQQVSTSEITQQTYLGLHLQEPLPFRDLIKHFFKFYKFISLCYYDSPHILNIYLNKPLPDNYSQGEDSHVEVLYSDRLFNKSYKTGKEYFEFLLTYNEIESLFPSVIKQWFQLYDKISPAINLFTELLQKRDNSLELKFLSIMQAVETFHRNLYGGKDVSNEEHEERLKQIFENIPNHLTKWLKEKLAFSNEPSLRKRLNNLYDRIPTEVTARLIKEKKPFIDSIIKTRNYYTHYDHKLKKYIMSNNEISKTVEKLKIFLICLLLSELGLPKDIIVKAVQLEKVYPFAEI